MAYQFTQTGAQIQSILDQVPTNTSDIASLNATLTKKTAYKLLSAQSNETSTLPANTVTILHYDFTLPTGYSIVSAWDNSYYAGIVATPIRIENGRVNMAYYSPGGIGTARQYTCKVLAMPNVSSS